jgi:hypothetical protein
MKALTSFLAPMHVTALNAFRQFNHRKVDLYVPWNSGGVANHRRSRLDPGILNGLNGPGNQDGRAGLQGSGASIP